MNYRLLEQDICPHCEEQLVWEDLLWEDREYYEDTAEAYCVDCQITYQCGDNLYSQIRQLNKSHAVEEDICIVHNHVWHSTLLIPAVNNNWGSYWLPDGSRWHRTPRGQAAIRAKDCSYLSETTEEYKEYLASGNERQTNTL